MTHNAEFDMNVKCPEGPLERIVGRLRDAITDYDGSQIADDAQPLDWLTAGDIRRALAEIERLQAICVMTAGRWWRVCAPDGSIWCETSNAREAAERMRPGDSLYRQYECVGIEWRHVAGPELPPNQTKRTEV